MAQSRAVTMVRQRKELVNCQFWEIKVLQRLLGVRNLDFGQVWKPPPLVSPESGNSANLTHIPSHLGVIFAPHFLALPTTNGLKHVVSSTSLSICTDQIPFLLHISVALRKKKVNCCWISFFLFSFFGGNFL